MTKSFKISVLAIYVFCSLALAGCVSIAKSETLPQLRSGENVIPSSTPQREIPKAKGLVSDFAGVLSAEESKTLGSALSELQRRGKVDFRIAIVRSTMGEDMIGYSLTMAKEWKVGSEKGGALMVVAIEDRTWRIQIDKKLEDEFTDAEIKTIGDTMIPHFREQKYYDGLKACVETFNKELSRKRGVAAITVMQK